MTGASQSPKRPDRRAHIGRLGEDLAADYVSGLGWQILVRNWRHRQGELDLIADATDVLVVVEVKTRASLTYDDPVAAVTPRKLAKMRQLCMLWLTEQDRHWPVIRFDVVSVRLDRSNPDRRDLATLTHHRGIFE